MSPQAIFLFLISNACLKNSIPNSSASSRRPAWLDSHFFETHAFGEAGEVAWFFVGELRRRAA
jgi:hypothetical protein